MWRVNRSGLAVGLSSRAVAPAHEGHWCVTVARELRRWVHATKLSDDVSKPVCRRRCNLTA